METIGILDPLKPKLKRLNLKPQSAQEACRRFGADWALGLMGFYLAFAFRA